MNKKFKVESFLSGDYFYYLAKCVATVVTLDTITGFLGNKIQTDIRLDLELKDDLKQNRKHFTYLVKK